MRGVNFAISDDYPGLKARNHGSACGGLRNTASFRSKEKRPSTEANSSFSSSRKSSTASEVPSCATCSIAISKSLEPRRSRNNFATFWERANARTALSFFEEWSAQADDRGGENAKNKRPVCVFQEHKRTNCVGRLCFLLLDCKCVFREEKALVSLQITPRRIGSWQAEQTFRRSNICLTNLSH
jgi:hypothetical protein